MARPAPRDPELFAALIAVLRATADPQPASAEVTTVAERAKRDVDPAVAGRLVKHFDRINPRIRRKALGEWFERPVELTARQIDGEAAPAPVESGGSGGFGGRLLGETFGPGEGVTESMTDGESANDASIPPTYTVTYRGMYAEAETSWDGLTDSDEVYFQTFATHIEADGANSPTRAEQHPIDKQIYEDVDDGEPRIGPVAAVWKGDRLPMSLTVVAFEHDYGDPNKYREEIAAVVAAAVALLSYLYPPSALAKALIGTLTPLLVAALNWLIDTEDDRIGEPFIEVLDVPKAEEFGRRYPSPYASADGSTSVADLEGHFFSSHRGSGAHYVAAFQVDREPPLDRDSGPIL